MLNPEGCRVLIALDKVKETTAGGLYIPETTRDKQEKTGVYGTVMAIGPSAVVELGDGAGRVEKEQREQLKVGDHILLVRHSGVLSDQTTNDGRPLLIINDEDVLCRIDMEN